jgi:hypothetical protein
MGHQADPAHCYKFSFPHKIAVHLTKHMHIVFVTGENEYSRYNYRRYTSALLFDVCLSVWCYYLNGVFLSVWYLPTCLLNWMICSTGCLTTCDVCSTVWCLPIYMTSSSLYGVCYTVWCLTLPVWLPTCIISSYLWCLPICVMFSYLYDVGLPVCLLSFMMSA